MKSAMLLLMMVTMSGFLRADDQPKTLNDLLDRRIKVNEEYRDRFTKEAEDTQFAKELPPLEKKLGQEWVDYLTYVKSLQDDKRKEGMLRLEIVGEITGAYYDIEYAEGLLEMSKARGALQRWKRELGYLDQITGKAGEEGDGNEGAADEKKGK